MTAALNGSGPSVRYSFVLEYLAIVIGFHTADPQEKDWFLRQIGKNEERGHKLGFSEEELSALNFLVLQVKANARELSALAQRISIKTQ